ncbi:MAG TPA: TonB-dependent receptor [Bryobacteraceae bacterium]|nr:TonB-dependent receptor [Bryobacteraceae bacterium]
MFESIRRQMGLGAALGIFVLAVCIHADAQTTFATITGTVTDAAGAVIPKAEIEATHVASNYSYKTQSNEVGNFTLAQLREGEYILQATAAGFNSFEAKEIRLAARDVRRIDVSLTVGAVQTSVQVTAGATVIETETARISDTRSAYVIKALPLVRFGWNLMAASPGVTTSTEGSWRRFAGSGLNQSSVSIDGISIDDLQGGNQISPLVASVDSYAEIRVDSVNNTAEFGTVGNVTVVSKSGTNEFHGTAFDYYSTPWFRARNPFALQRGTGVSHSPGGSVGGPVFIPKLYNGRNKTFFFYSFETSRGSDIQQTLNPTVPLASWRTGDFSSLLPKVVVHDPATGVPFPNNIIPASRINPVAQKIQERFYPLPNFGSTTVLQNQNYRELKVRPFDPNTYWTVRGDHRFSDKAMFFARFTWQRQWNTSYQANLPTIGQLWNQRNTRALASSFSYSIKPNLLYEFRYGINFNNNPLHGPVKGKELVSQLGLQGLTPDLPDMYGILNVGFDGIPIQPISQIAEASPGNSQMAHINQQSISWFRGRHNIKAGFGFVHVDWAELGADDNLFGNINFSDRFTGFDYADFLLGIPTEMARSPRPLFNESLRNGYDFFVQDDFKVSSRLTLNLGLRYEYHPYWYEKEKLFSNFDVATGRIVIPDGALSKVSPFFPQNFAPLVEASKAGYPSQTLIRNDKNNFAPRIGIAYRPWGINTVFRGGFGIFYDNAPVTMNEGGSPFILNEPEFTNPAPNPVVVLPRVFPAAGTGAGEASLPTAYPQNLRIPYSMQYSFTAEHQVGNTGLRASVVGTNTRQGVYRYNINQPVPDNRPYIAKPRLFPQYADINYFTNGAGHQYNALTLEAKRPLSKGLMFQASWVYARDIGDLNTFQLPENAYDRQRERAVWVDIPTHRIAASMIYQFPFGHGRHFLANANRAVDTVFGGWELSGVNLTQTGQFLTPFWNGPDPTGTRYSASSTPARVTLRPNMLRNPNLPSGERSVTRWFDATAFGPPTPGSFGTSAKGVIIGPGSTVTHLSLAKYIKFTERLALRPEFSAFNVFNHPNWANPRTNITSAPGVISGVVGRNDLDSSGPRTLRASLRLEW